MENKDKTPIFSYRGKDGKMKAVYSTSVLTKEDLDAIMWQMLRTNGAGIKGLTKIHYRTIAIHMMAYAETFSPSHSMRYSIMRDFVRSIFSLKPDSHG